MDNSTSIISPQIKTRWVPILTLGAVLSASLLLALLIVRGPAFMLSMLALVVLIFVSTWKQNWLVYAFMLVPIWFYNDWNYTEKPLIYVGYNIYVSDLFILLIVSATLLSIIVNKTHEAFRSKLGVAVSLYLGWIFLEILRGIPTWGGSALGESRFVILVCAYFPVVHSIKTITHFKKFILFFFLTIVSYILYLQLWRFFIQFQGDLGLMLQARLMGADAALLAASVFVFCLVFFLDGNIKRYKLFFLSVMIFFGFLIPLGARTGFVAWIVGVVFVLMRKYKSALLKPRLSLIFLVGVLAILYWNTNILDPEENLDGTTSRTFSFIEEQQRGAGTTGWRLMAWSNLLEKTLQGNIIFGEGLGGYYDLFSIGEKGVPPHNEWLLVLNKLGLIGFILLLYLVWQFYKTGNGFLRTVSNSELKSYMEGIFAVFLVGLIGGVFFGFFPFVWVVVGLQSCLVYVSKNLNETNANSEMRPMTEL